MATDTTFRSAEAELIERLRSEELDSIRSEVAAGRRHHILKTLDERGRAQELVRQQYTGRYPFELLQNANDASGDEASAGHTVRFVLTEDALLVADMGAGFGPAQIRAICGLGRSSKDPRKSIGYKGLGFKSVGEITDDPQVFSVNVGFRFNDEKVRAQVAKLVGELHPDQRLPVYAFPFPVTPEDVGGDAAEIDALLDAGYRTIFRLPLRADVSRADVALHLEQTLSPRLLLFLDATEELHLQGTEDDFVATAVREDRGDHVEMLVEARGETKHWLAFQRMVDIPDRRLVSPLGEAWREVERVRAAVAVPLNRHGVPSRLDAQPIHVYFPTHEESGFGLVLQADFALELDRRGIAATPEATRYNTWLATELGDLFGEVARGLGTRYPQDPSVVSALALVARPSGFGERIVERALMRFGETEFVPTLSGAPRLPSESLLLPATVPDPGTAHACINTSDLGPLVVPEVEVDGKARQLLREHLATSELSLVDALSRLERPDDGQVVGYYEFLVGWSEDEGIRTFSSALGEVDCVRTVSGQWRAPTDRLFFPRQREEVHFPEGLEVPIVAIPDVEGLRPLLEAAGVSAFEWRQLLPEFIFPLLTDPETEPEKRALGLQALRLYYETERSGDPRLRAQAARVLLPATRAGDISQELVPAEEIYFSEAWTGEDGLQLLYGPFGEPEFLGIDPPQDPDVRSSELDFFEWLGVARHPRPDPRVVDQRDVHMVHALSRHPHARTYEQYWEAWLARPDVIAASRCDQGHSASQQLRASYGLDRFPELVATGDAARLGLLWDELAKNWATHYRNAQSAIFYCQHTGHGGERTRMAPSLMAHMLERFEWVPCMRRGELDLVRPDHAWRLTKDTPRRVAERVAALPADLDQHWASGLCADLAIVDAARPQVGHLVQLLEDLAEEWDHMEEDEADARAVTESARWVMRTLNDVISDDVSVLKSVDVPLLARHNGRRIFHFRPYVADDSFLAETWEPSLPILDADRDLRQLHTALELPSLDKLTKKIPVPLGARPDAQAALREELDATLPFLAAVAVEAVPSREEDVYRGLARLEVEVCEDLVVRYELDGEVRERREAVAFIAERQEQDGIVRRRIGTAHLELDPGTGRPHWYVFGPQLARFLNVPTQGDAFSLLLSGDRTSRREYLRSRLIPDEGLEEARIRLDQPPLEDDLSDLIGDLTDLQPDEQGEDLSGGDQLGGHEQQGDHAERGTTEDAELGEAESEDAELTEGEQEALPPVDHDSVAITDAEVETCEMKYDRPGDRPGGGGGLGPAGPVDHERRQRLQRTIGKRGESVVFEAEQRRVVRSGQDPGRVVWRSKEHPFAPYDVESIDEDGHTMFIEVKSTSGDDPYDPFQISHSELMWALRHRSRYYIYRVTNAHTVTPSILRFRDPIAMLQDGSAELGLSGARLAFHAPREGAESV